MSDHEPFNDEQKQYLQGFLAGSGLARVLRGLPAVAAPTTTADTGGSGSSVSAARPAESVHTDAQNRLLAEGRRLSAEEQAKRAKNPFEMWDEMRANAAERRFPQGTDVFLYKFHGLFYVAPAQDSFMCRLRFPGGIANSHQFRGVADLAQRYGGGYADVTTRANLQIREIAAGHAIEMIESLQDLGILNRGAGADNVRNITGAPTAGIDRQELFDTRPLTREMHHYILQHRELYGLPRKFNIAFDGGGTTSALADTNDVGFMAVRVSDGRDVPPDVYFRMELGGMTGHKEFGRDAGVLLRADECVAVGAAVVRAFIAHGDRTDRRQARLKYVLDRLGQERFLAETQRHLSFPLRQFPRESCEPRGPVHRLAHVGFHPQRQEGMYYAGVVLPVGRLRAEQMQALADLADRHGSGTIRLTVWQNLLISDIPAAQMDRVRQELETIGLHWSATNIRAGLVACTGNGGCKFAAGNTKGHALQIAEHLESRLELDQPVNIHLTGCPHSCAQHYIGDIGLLATKVPVGDDLVEAYHVFAGGGHGDERNIGRELYRDVPSDQVSSVVERMLTGYQAHRLSPAESFRDFSGRLSTEELRERFDPNPVPLPGSFSAP